MSSETRLSRQDRPWLATFHACKSDYQLGLFGRVDIPPQSLSALLLSVRRRVSLFFLPSIVLPYPVYHPRYTSLGSTYNTFRNPALLIDDGSPPDGMQASSREHRSVLGYIVTRSPLFSLCPPPPSRHPKPRRNRKNEHTANFYSR